MNTLKLVEHDSDRSSDGSFSLYLTIDGVEFELYGGSFDPSSSSGRSNKLSKLRAKANRVALELGIEVEEDIY